MVQRNTLALGGWSVAVAEAAGAVSAFLILGSTRFALFLLTCAIGTAGVTAATLALINRPAGGPGASPGQGPDDGGPPDEPEPPSWWPAFESELREHMRIHDRAPVPSGR